MSSELSFDNHYFPCINPGTNRSSPLVFNLEFILCLFLFIFIISFWLSPGGLAWSVSKIYCHVQARSAIPGPSGLPILGMIMAFTSSLTHRVLAKTSHSLKATKLMAFSVGFTRFIISSHPDTAKDILNSSAFADRPIKESAYELLFHRAMGFAPFGQYWRCLRRISSTYLFSPKRIASFGEFRREIGLKMVSEIKGLMENDAEVIKIRKILQFASLNNVMMSVFGRRYEFGRGVVLDGESCELESLVSEGYELLGIFNWSDHFPILGWFDLQGVRKRCRKLVCRVNVFVGKIIEEHRFNRVTKSGIKEGGNHDNDHDFCGGDFVDVLLDLQEENKLMDSDLVAILWEMIFRGTDTVAILLEWILARLILHQDIQYKAQSEIDNVVGNKLVSDSDLPNLRYLQAIVKETLRLHPPGPLLSWARLAIHDTHIGSHFIPAGTTAMVNMWSITHDEKFWSEPEKFRPERFIEEEVSVMGSDLRLAPFGAGRRVCPGKVMGLATVELWLAQLLQSFKLVASDNYGVDLTENLNLSLEMKNSLVFKAVARVSV